jgi:membrane associated rhomboid family serine protease
VYALIAAHLATVILNWQEDGSVRIRKVIHSPLTRTIRIAFICLLTVHDIAIGVYAKYFSDEPNRTGFMGHICGAIAGLLIGVFALQNRRVRDRIHSCRTKSRNVSPATK